MTQSYALAAPELELFAHVTPKNIRIHLPSEYLHIDQQAPKSRNRKLQADLYDYLRMKLPAVKDLVNESHEQLGSHLDPEEEFYQFNALTYPAVSSTRTARRLFTETQNYSDRPLPRPSEIFEVLNAYHFHRLALKAALENPHRTIYVGRHIWN